MTDRTGKEHTMKRIAIIAGIAAALGVAPSVAGAANVPQVSSVQVAKQQIHLVQRAQAQRVVAQKASAQRATAQRAGVLRVSLLSAQLR
jgi:hypothetical protein